jgi:translation initiation factor 1 (eIF-1/SUI1)
MRQIQAETEKNGEIDLKNQKSKTNKTAKADLTLRTTGKPTRIGIKNKTETFLRRVAARCKTELKCSARLEVTNGGRDKTIVLDGIPRIDPEINLKTDQTNRIVKLLVSMGIKREQMHVRTFAGDQKQQPSQKAQQAM